MQRRKQIYHVLSAAAVLVALVGSVVVNEWSKGMAGVLRKQGLAVGDPDLTLPVLVVGVGLFVAALCQVMVWRCDVRWRAEQQHRQIMAALKALYDARGR